MTDAGIRSLISDSGESEAVGMKLHDTVSNGSWSLSSLLKPHNDALPELIVE
jgi:hypothetical protein